MILLVPEYVQRGALFPGNHYCRSLHLFASVSLNVHSCKRTALLRATWSKPRVIKPSCKRRIFTLTVSGHAAPVTDPFFPPGRVSTYKSFDSNEINLNHTFRLLFSRANHTPLRRQDGSSFRTSTPNTRFEKSIDSVNELRKRIELDVTAGCTWCCVTIKPLNPL